MRREPPKTVTWTETRNGIFVILAVSAGFAGLSWFWGNPPSLEELFVGIFVLAVVVAFRFAGYFAARLEALDDEMKAAHSATETNIETNIVENLNELNQRLKHLEKEVDFIART